MAKVMKICDVLNLSMNDEFNSLYLVLDDMNIVNTETGDIVKGSIRFYGKSLFPGQFIYLAKDLFPHPELLDYYLNGSLWDKCEEFKLIDAWYKRNLGYSAYSTRKRK